MSTSAVVSDNRVSEIAASLANGPAERGMGWRVSIDGILFFTKVVTEGAEYEFSWNDAICYRISNHYSPCCGSPAGPFAKLATLGQRHRTSPGVASLLGRAEGASRHWWDGGRAGNGVSYTRDWSLVFRPGGSYV
jgi:hypothetical protein